MEDARQAKREKVEGGSYRKLERESGGNEVFHLFLYLGSKIWATCKRARFPGNFLIFPEWIP